MSCPLVPGVEETVSVTQLFMTTTPIFMWINTRLKNTILSHISTMKSQCIINIMCIMQSQLTLLEVATISMNNITVTTTTSTAKMSITMTMRVIHMTMISTTRDIKTTDMIISIMSMVTTTATCTMSTFTTDLMKTTTVVNITSMGPPILLRITASQQTPTFMRSSTILTIITMITRGSGPII